MKDLKDREIEKLLTTSQRPEPPKDLLSQLKRDIPEDLDLKTLHEIRPNDAGSRRSWLLAAALLSTLGASFLTWQLQQQPELAPEVYFEHAEQNQARSTRGGDASLTTRGGPTPSEDAELIPHSPAQTQPHDLMPIADEAEAHKAKAHTVETASTAKEVSRAAVAPSAPENGPDEILKTVAAPEKRPAEPTDSTVQTETTDRSVPEAQAEMTVQTEISVEPQLLTRDVTEPMLDQLQKQADPGPQISNASIASSSEATRMGISSESQVEREPEEEEITSRKRRFVLPRIRSMAQAPQSLAQPSSRYRSAMQRSSDQHLNRQADVSPYEIVSGFLESGFWPEPESFETADFVRSFLNIEQNSRDSSGDSLSSPDDRHEDGDRLEELEVLAQTFAEVLKGQRSKDELRDLVGKARRLHLDQDRIRLIEDALRIHEAENQLENPR